MSWDDLRSAFRNRITRAVDSARGVLDRVRPPSPAPAPPPDTVGSAMPPHDDALQRAEAAMAVRDWASAIEQWAKVVEQAPGAPLPTRAQHAEWSRFAWDAMAAHWVRTNTVASEALYLAVAEILVVHDFPEAAESVLLLGREHHPSSHLVAFQSAQLAMARRDWPVAITRWRTLIDLAPQQVPDRAYIGLCVAFHAQDDASAAGAIIERARAHHPHLDGLAEELHENRLAIQQCSAKSEATGAITLRLIRYSPRSTLSTQLRSGTYITKSEIGARLATVADQLGHVPWITRVSWLMARRYAACTQALAALPARTIIEAIQFHIITELSTLIPIRRIARELAGESGDQPIFIDIPSTTISCLKCWAPNEMEPFFLYAELARRGANPILCLRQEERRLSRESALHFALDASWDRAASIPVTANRSSRTALVPAGIRGLGEVLEDWGGAHVFPSGQIFSQATPLEFSATIYPPEIHAGDLEIPFQREHTLCSRNPAGDQVSASIETAANVDVDLFRGIDRMAGDLISSMAAAAEKAVATHEITTLHVCDHHFLESALMANAVIARGGTLTLLPHSANPIGVDTRRPGEVEKVICITLAGKNAWQKQLPDADVRLASHLMLPAPTQAAPPQPDKPLTVVVIGTSSVMGRFPRLPYRDHRESFHRFATALSKLDQVRFVFKPKGEMFESSTWLYRLTEGKIPFEASLAPPLLVDFPNMLFVTVSFGSTALLEGMSRGIPAMIVRDFAMEDYTTIDTDIVPTGSTEQIIEQIRACADPAYRQRLIDVQGAYYRAETGHS